MLGPIDSDSFFVYCKVPERMALAGGVAPEDLHITLCYIHTDPETAAIAHSAVKVFTGNNFPINVTANGVGMLGKDNAFVVNLTGQEIHSLRNGLIDHLATNTPLSYEECQGKFEIYTPHFTISYMDEMSEQPDLQAVHDRYRDQSFDITQIGVMYGGEELGTYTLGEPVPTTLLKDPSLLPANYLATFKMLAVRIGQSTGMRGFRMPPPDPLSEPGVPVRILPLPLTGTCKITEGHLDAEVIGAIAEAYLENETDLWLTGWFSDSYEAYEVLSKVMNGEITGCSVDPDEDNQSEIYLADNRMGFEEWFTRWRLGGVTITPHPAIPSAGLIEVQMNNEYFDGEIFKIPGAEKRLALPQITRALTAEPLPSLMELMASGGLSLGDKTWDELELRLADHFYSGGGTENLKALFQGLGDITIDAPTEFFSNPRLSGPTAPTLKNGRYFGHLAEWGVCHRGLGVSVGGNGCILAPHSACNYNEFNLIPLQLSNGSVVKVGRITVGTNHADPFASVDRAVGHYENTGFCAAYVVTGEDAYGIWFSGIPSPFSSVEQVHTLTTAPLSGDWRTINGSLELIAVLSVNVPGFSIHASGARTSIDKKTGKVMAMTTMTAGGHSSGTYTSISTNPVVPCGCTDKQGNRFDVEVHDDGTILVAGATIDSVDILAKTLGFEIDSNGAIRPHGWSANEAERIRRENAQQRVLKMVGARMGVSQ